MLILLLNQYQDAPDGLYLQDHNSRTRDTAVGPFGVHHLVTPPRATGVVQRAVLVARATWPLMVVVRITALRQFLFVSVPSGV